MAQRKKTSPVGGPGPAAMSLLFIVYSNAVDEEITEIVLRHSGGYTKFTGVSGEGTREPHLGTHIWPSMNNCIMTAIGAEQKRALADEVLYLKEKFPGVGINVFATRLEERL